MVDSGRTSAESFAETFAPDRNRNVPKPSEFLWLGAGSTLILATAALLTLAWFALHRNLPTTGPLAMRRSPGASVAELRSRNHAAAPWIALSSLPLFLAGNWLLVTRPGNKRAKVALGACVVLFSIGLMVASSVSGGCVGVGSC
jgi:hypothetical protein